MKEELAKLIICPGQGHCSVEFETNADFPSFVMFGMLKMVFGTKLKNNILFKYSLLFHMGYLYY